MYDSRTDKSPKSRYRTSFDREQTSIRRHWNRSMRAAYTQAIREQRWYDLPTRGRPGTSGWLTW